MANGNDTTRVVGLNSSLWIARLLALSSAEGSLNRTQIVILPDEAAERDFHESLSFFAPSLTVIGLPAWDASPYSQLYPSSRISGSRVRGLYCLNSPSAGSIITGTVDAFLQRSMSPESLFDHTTQFSVGMSLSPSFFKELALLGYQSAPQVEDIGQFSKRGGVVDIFSPSLFSPVRLELMGDQIESMRTFDTQTQTSIQEISSFVLLPAREVVLTDEVRERTADLFRKDCEHRGLHSSLFSQTLSDISRGQYFGGLEYLIGFAHSTLSCALDHIDKDAITWFCDDLDLVQKADLGHQELRFEFSKSQSQLICPSPDTLFVSSEFLQSRCTSQKIFTSQVELADSNENLPDDVVIRIRSRSLENFLRTAGETSLKDRILKFVARAREWKTNGLSCYVACSTNSQAQRVKVFLEHAGLTAVLPGQDTYDWGSWDQFQKNELSALHLIPRKLPESQYSIDEGVVLVRDDDLLGRQSSHRFSTTKQAEKENSVSSFDFAEFSPGDYVVHVDHGVALYEGLKRMVVQGIEAEFIALQFRDGDKLYLPIYRVAQIQKYGHKGTLDKLGGTSWEKVKIRVRSHLKDMANDLLRLYAERSLIERPPFGKPDSEYLAFESQFPYEETEDQVATITSVLQDMQQRRPMDRLVCGDVGFGKTEVALRAAFKCAEERRQVAVLVPTTVLAFQHLETFTKRFKDWPIKLGMLSRFTSRTDTKKFVDQLKSGEMGVIVGTHRLLSKDIVFKDLGLLVIDEEQRFGVVHKEKIRKLKANVDTLALSATPIPRTLNMSLVGLRDLSLIRTAPIDRLPVRTYVVKRDDAMISKAIRSEIARGGQVFFVHNRVQSIYEVLTQLKNLVPEVRICVGHGQLPENELETVMLGFLRHEFDVLLCTTIIESGLDIGRANTILIDRADTFGLSQLYQLRGRVGRSKERAYCYLVVPAQGQIDPIAQQRLKTLQENTALGSGFKIAHHDLELRGAGSILGEAQSGFVDAVGYDLYLELLQEALVEVRGELRKPSIEPEINLRIPALIPDSYVPDIRSRLSIYRSLTSIRATEDLDKIEGDLRDQYGKLPDEVLNLLGVMLIRHECKELGVRDVSAGTKTISLAFTEHTPLSPQKVMGLAAQTNKKYSLTPDSRLIIRMNEITWPGVHTELVYLRKLAN